MATKLTGADILFIQDGKMRTIIYLLNDQTRRFSYHHQGPPFAIP